MYYGTLIRDCGVLWVLSIFLFIIPCITCIAYSGGIGNKGILILMLATKAAYKPLARPEQKRGAVVEGRSADRRQPHLVNLVTVENSQRVHVGIWDILGP